ncbi:Tat pathway signal sequence domain protein [Solihabitans fulvus]|uniref:Tat pathway signal sequence domain protein n=2 Tax=Solihabitans fulvus TaxID=1892852 RepID=A0A5B2XJ99_9PSEU|nr:Tat pathway signal sequence domain protein [Solihabitans fulvus]
MLLVAGALGLATLATAAPSALADNAPTISPPASTVTQAPTDKAGPSSTVTQAPDKPTAGVQVPDRPKGAPQTGGGPVEQSGVNAPLLGGVGALAAVAGLGAFVLRRRRATDAS